MAALRRVMRAIVSYCSPAVRSDGAPSLSDEMKGLLRQSLTDNPGLRVAVEVMMEKEKEKEKIMMDLLVEKDKTISTLQVNLLRSRGLNNTRGLFEFLQEALQMKMFGSRSTLRGPAMWEALLKLPAAQDLGSCITKATGIKDLVRQAAYVYGIYSNLSSHVHSGKYLAELAVSPKGKIQFERGPLSPEQAQVLRCLGDAANYVVEESEDTGTSVY